MFCKHKCLVVEDLRSYMGGEDDGPIIAERGQSPPESSPTQRVNTRSALIDKNDYQSVSA